MQYVLNNKPFLLSPVNLLRSNLSRLNLGGGNFIGLMSWIQRAKLGQVVPFDIKSESFFTLSQSGLSLT